MRIDEPASPDVDVVTPALVRRFAVTVGITDADLRLGAVAPFGLHWCLVPDAAPLADLAADGLARTSGAVMAPPEGFHHTLWAGADVVVHAPLRIGDTVSRRTRLLDLTHKTGRSGRLAFGRVEQVFSVDDEDRIVDVQRYVFRPEDHAVAPPRADADPPAYGEVIGEIRVDPLAVFRFSALTFNAHRIHFDATYAREVEGFVAPLVQGTLTATLLGLACERRSGRGGRGAITFQARAPVFCGDTLGIAATQVGRGQRLDALSGGRLVMTAEASPAPLEPTAARRGA